ncbi:MAG: cation transporter [Phycisphaerae bacterium]|nr:cation transporter [Gemmatimonadaceae bacterium]
MHVHAGPVHAHSHDGHHHGDGQGGHAPHGSGQGASGRHDHGPGHSHAPANFDKAFAIGISLNATFVLVEALYGYRANSLALVADAGHNLGDVLGLVLAWAGSTLARRRPTTRRTYGLRRFSILASLGNAGLLLVSVGAIAVEAVQRVGRPGEIATGTVMVVATIGILINGGTALLFARGRAGDINIRGAYLHMLGDAAISAGVVLAALVISITGFAWLDPVSSLVIAAFILWSSWQLALDSFNLAVDAVPRGIDPTAVRARLLALNEVTDVHYLHIWALSTTEVALTAHLVRPCEGGEDAVLNSANEALRHDFGIGHATLQFERGQQRLPCQQHTPARAAAIEPG